MQMCNKRYKTASKGLRVQMSNKRYKTDCVVKYTLCVSFTPWVQVCTCTFLIFQYGPAGVAIRGAKLYLFFLAI